MKRNQPEKKIHMAVLTWLQYNLRGALIHHSPNELGISGRAAMIQVVKHKRMGMREGFPDFLVIYKGRTVGLEVKAPRQYQTKAQKECERDFKANGSEYYVVRSIDDVQEVFK